MAKKAAGSGSKSNSKTKKTVTTKVRNTPIPKAPAAPSRASSSAATINPRRQITHEEIAKKAYEIYKSGRGGSQFENWIRAERELRAAQSSQSN